MAATRFLTPEADIGKCTKNQKKKKSFYPRSFAVKTDRPAADATTDGFGVEGNDDDDDDDPRSSSCSCSLTTTLSVTTANVLPAALNGAISFTRSRELMLYRLLVLIGRDD